MKPNSKKILTKALKHRLRHFRKVRIKVVRASTAEAVHALRVEMRRLLAVFELFRRLRPSRPFPEIPRWLKRERKKLGAWRETQVCLALLGEFPSEAGAKVSARWRQRERRQARRMRKALAKGARARLRRLAALQRKSCGRVRRDFSSATVAARLAEELEQRQERLRAGVERARREPGHLHEARIALKKFRYALEAVQPLLTSAEAPVLDSLHSLQARMGAIHDMDELLARLREEEGAAALSAVWRRRRRQRWRAFQDEAAEFLEEAKRTKLGGNAARIRRGPAKRARIK